MTKTAPVQTLLDLSQLRLDQATRTLGSLISGEQAAADLSVVNVIPGYVGGRYGCRTLDRLR